MDWLSYTVEELSNRKIWLKMDTSAQKNMLGKHERKINRHEGGNEMVQLGQMEIWEKRTMKDNIWEDNSWEF